MTDFEAENTRIRGLIADMTIALAVCPPAEQPLWREEIEKAHSYLAELAPDDAEDDAADFPHLVTAR